MYLRAENLTKTYDERTIFQNLSFEMQEGGRLLITGASGTGKTTLIRILLGLEKPDSGRVDTDLPRLGKGALRAGCVFQNDRLAGDFSAVENVAAADGLDRSGFSEIRQMLVRLLPTDSIDQPVRELSGGMRRRVCIVRALMSDAGIIIFDEPFSGLDEENRKRCFELIREQQGNRMLIMTAHSRTEAYNDFREVTPGEKTQAS